MKKETETVTFKFERFKKQQKAKKPKLDMNAIKRIKYMTEEELEKDTNRLAKEQGWKNA